MVESSYARETTINVICDDCLHDFAASRAGP
jgi:hypothetical protein